MRSKVVTINNKAITVQEMRIGELEELVGQLFPETEGNLANLKIENILSTEVGLEVLYEKLPILFPSLKEEDIKNAYMSEIEELVGAFFDVNFLGIKKLIKPLTALAQAGLMQK